MPAYSPEQLPSPEELREDPEDHRHPQPHQHPEAVLREVPAGGRRAGQARGRRAPGRLQVGLPDPRLQRDQSRWSSCSYNLERPKYDVDECHQRGMTYSAPIKVVVRLVVWDKDEETGAQSHPRRQGAGGLLRRDPADDRERDLHHQRHRARGGRASCTAAPGAFFDHDKGKSHTLGQAALQRPDHPVPRLVDRLPSSTTRTCSTSASTGGGSCPATVLIRALGAVPDTAKKNPIEFKGTTEEILNYYYATETIYLHSASEFEKSVELELLPGQRATRDIKTKSGEVIVKKNRKFTRGAIKKLEAAKMQHAAHRRRRAVHQGLGLRRGGRGHRRGDPRVQRGGQPGEGGRAPQARHEGVQGPLHRQPQRRPVPAGDVDAGQDRLAGAGDHGDLPAAAPG